MERGAADEPGCCLRGVQDAQEGLGIAPGPGKGTKAALPLSLLGFFS